MDAFNGNPPRQDPADPLAYASGRIEGAAWREQGLVLNEMLKQNRLPHMADPG